MRAIELVLAACSSEHYRAGDSYVGLMVPLIQRGCGFKCRVDR